MWHTHRVKESPSTAPLIDMEGHFEGHRTMITTLQHHNTGQTPRSPHVVSLIPSTGPNGQQLPQVRTLYAQPSCHNLDSDCGLDSRSPVCLHSCGKDRSLGVVWHQVESAPISCRGHMPCECRVADQSQSQIMLGPQVHCMHPVTFNPTIHYRSLYFALLHQGVLSDVLMTPFVPTCLCMKGFGPLPHPLAPPPGD